MFRRRRSHLALLLSLVFSYAASGGPAQYVISTFAGSPVREGATATSVSVYPRTITHDASGNIYFADYTRIYELNAGGTLSVVAGTGFYGQGADGAPASMSAISSPNGLAFDSAGNLYLSTGNRIRKVDAATHNITTIAGGLTGGFAGDNGPASAALLNGVSGIAIDSVGNLYVCDSVNNRVRKVALSTGIITAFAGNGATGSLTGTNGDGAQATAAQLQAPSSIAFDSSGNTYIADRNHNKIRKVTSSGVISTIAGTGQFGFAGDGLAATSANLGAPYSVVGDASGNLYIGDTSNVRIRKLVLATGIITTVAGSGISGSSGDNGPALSASFSDPVAVDVDRAGSLYAADLEAGTLRKIISSGTITTVAGGGSGGDGGAGLDAQFNYPSQVAFNPSAHLIYISEDTRIRAMDSVSGKISTFAGTGVSGFNGDSGPATQARLGRFGAPAALDASHNVYIADISNQRIRRIDAATGVITTIAGTGDTGFSGDGGDAKAAKLNTPNDVKLDSAGNIYFADMGNHRVRKIDAVSGVITTVAGGDTPSSAGGFAGDGGAAAKAQLHSPAGIAFDAAGNLYIADYNNHRIRKVTAAGVISTIAGSDTPNNAGGFAGDNGPAVSAQMNKPYSVCADASGNLFIAEYGGSRIRRVAVDGTIATIAGNGTPGFSGDGGIATSATINQPQGVAVDSAGQVYISDTFNMRVRMLTPVRITSEGIVNGASNLSGAIAPGEILSIYGTDFGPPQGASASLNSSGKVDVIAGSTRVLFDGQPGPIAYAVANQVNVIAPYSLAGKSSTQIQVEYLGQLTNPVTIPVMAAVPGIFSYDSSGKGQAVLVNENATLNTPSNPAPRGSYVYFYATGEGQTNPGGIDGKLAADPYPAPVLFAAIKLGSSTIMPLYAGAAPGFVAGVMQVNFQIPADAPAGSAIPLTLLIGGAPSQSGITIAIQ